MKIAFTLEYWLDDNWYVGRIKEIPGVFSQGKTLEELEDNIKDAYNMIINDNEEVLPDIEKKTKEILLTH